ncbi:MAG: PAS domain S-box protein [Spirochaetota bacterium]
MAEKKNNNNLEVTVLLSCLLLASFLWMTHAIFEFLYGHTNDTFAASVLPLNDAPEILHRVIMCSIIILGGIIVGAILKRHAEQRNSKEALADDLKATLNSIGDAVIATDRDGRITRMNPVAERLTGMSAEKVVGRMLPEAFRIINAMTRAPVEDPVSKVLSTGDIVGLANHTALLSHNGKEYQIADSGAPIRDADGNIVGVVLVFRDVTDEYAVRERLEKSEEDLRITLNSIGDAVIATDKDGRVTRMNPVAASLTGMRSGEAVGRTLTEVFRIINAVTREPADDPVSRVLATGEIVGLANHTALLSHDGKEYQIADSGAPIRDASGNVVGVVLVFRDVTDEYAMREKLAVNEERMHSLFSNMNEGVALHDVVLDDAGKPIEYRIVDINPRYEKIIGVKREDVVGKLSCEAYRTPEPPYLMEFTSVGLTGIPYRFETYFPPMDKHFSISVAPWGRNGFATIFSDISERKKTEEAIRKKTEELDNFFNNNLDLLCIADTNGYFHRLNPEWVNTLGYDLKELEGSKFLDLVHPDDMTATMAAMSALSGQKKVINFINRFRRRDGTYCYLEWRSFPVGNLIHAAARDITARTQAEEMLKANEARFRQTFDDSPVGTAMVSLENKFIRCNNAFCRYLGYSEQELIGRTFSEITFPEDRHIGLQEVKEIARGERDIAKLQKRYLRKDGVIVWGQVSISMVRGKGNDDTYFLPIIEDITERKRSENARAEAQRFSDALIDGMPGIFYLYDSGLYLRRWNRNHEKELGYSAAELNGKHVGTWHRTDEARSAAIRGIESVMRDGGTAFFEGTLLHRDGREIPYLLSATRIETNNGPMMFGFGIDISSRLTAEAALRESEERNRSFLKAVPDLMFVFDSQGTFIDYNAERQDELYARPVDFIGKRIRDVLPPNVAGPLMDTADRVDKTGIMGMLEYELAMPAGETRTFEARITPYGPGRLAALVRDITVQKNEEAERKRQEERLMQSEKLMSLGELTAGLAHEINQPLTAISLGLSNAMLLASPEHMNADKVREKLSRLSENVKRITALMEHVRTFSRDQKSADIGVHRIESAIDGALSLVRVQYENDLITFTVRHEHDGLCFRGNRYRLEQVLLNLLTNARDSLSERSVKNTHLRKEIAIRTFGEGASVVISVRDNGMGISSAGMRRLFEPFFTTKPVGKGTGLGLSVSYGIIRDMNGTIEAKSEEGSFAEFIIRLPAVQG